MITALPLLSSALSLAAPTVSAPAVAAAGSATAAGNDFGHMMSQMASNTVQSLKTAESMSIDGIKGNANVQAVVQAVMQAQEALQTTVAIRDKAVGAFQEITRMSI